MTTLMMVNGYRLAQIIYVVSKLRIPDLLAGGSQSARDLARFCGVDADALFRVLRAAAVSMNLVTFSPRTMDPH